MFMLLNDWVGCSASHKCVASVKATRSDPFVSKVEKVEYDLRRPGHRNQQPSVNMKQGWVLTGADENHAYEAKMKLNKS